MTVTNQTKLYTADQELTKLMKEAAASGETLHLRADDTIYRLRVEGVDNGAEAPDIWANYDPELVRAAVRRSRNLTSRIATEDLDPIIADIRAQRDQASDDSLV